MGKSIIVTIGRQFGSGGRTIGKKLAEQLGIAYYDKELISLASKESGICGEFFWESRWEDFREFIEGIGYGIYDK